MDLDSLTDQFFAYAAAGDHDALVAMCADDCVVKQNIAEETTAEGLRDLVAMLAAAGVTTAYSDVRRITGDRTVTEQHLITLSRADGVESASDVCVVLRFDDDGRITRLDEYLDSAAFAELLG